MADIEHKDIPDPELHEPKGVAGASANEVYVADGVGGGAWMDVNLVNPHNLVAYASRGVSSENAPVVVNLVQAGDLTLRTLSDYVPFGQDMDESPDKLNMGFDAEGHFVIPIKGVYQFNFWMSENNTVSDAILGVTLYKGNPVGFPDLTTLGMVEGAVMRDRTKDTNNVSDIAFGGITVLEVGDEVGIAMATAGAGASTVTISDSHLSIILLEELA